MKVERTSQVQITLDEGEAETLALYLIDTDYPLDFAASAEALNDFSSDLINALDAAGVEVPE